MADEQTPEQVNQEMFKEALAPPPEPSSATTETAAPEVQPQVPAEAPVPPVPPEPPEAAIPSWRLREEAEARRQAEQRAALLEARLNQVAEHLRQQTKQPDFFENPGQATQEIIARQLQPYIDETRRTQMYLGKMLAETAHGADKVSAAEQAFLAARDDASLDPADYERVVTSPNRYDAVVQWHKRQTVLSSVGDDPAAWFEKQLEAKLADPQFQAKLLEKVRTDAATRPSMTKLPPSLSKTTATAPNAGPSEGDMSDQSLFAFAMRP